MSCFFCQIASGEILTEKLYEDDLVIAFNDLEPQAPVHILIIPKQHIESINDISSANSHAIARIFEVTGKLAKEKGLTENGYRIVSNCGEWGGQSVMHLHFHLLGGRSMKWPPG